MYWSNQLLILYVIHSLIALACYDLKVLIIMQKTSAVVLGGSGNVGKEAVKALVASGFYERIALVSRRPLPELENLHPSIKVVVCDLDAMESNLNFSGYAAAVMAIGTGKASTVSKDELYHIDTIIPFNFARKCKADGVQHMTILSVVGADSTATYSSVTKSAAGFGWYNHCKGRAEELIAGVGFQSLSVFRPAAIVGNSNTPGFVSWLFPKIDWMLPSKYQSISTVELGTRMVKALNQQVRGEWSGYRVYEGANLHEPL